MDDWTLSSVAPFNSTGLDDRINDNSSIWYERDFDRKLIQALQITFSILDTLIGCMANSFLLLVILSSGSLRANMRNALIANLAAADLLVDVTHPPLIADYNVRRKWIHGCYAHLFYQFLTLIAFQSLSMWGMITINVLLLVRIARTTPLTSLVTFSLPLPPALWRRRLKLGLKIVVVALPWLLAVVITIPLTVIGKEEFWNNLQPETADLCFIPFAVLDMSNYNVLLFLLPTSILSAIFVGIGAICLYRRHTKRVQLSFPTSHLQTTITDTTSMSTAAATSESWMAAEATTTTTTTAATTTTTTTCREMESKLEPISPYLVATVITVVMMGSTHLLLINFDNDIHYFIIVLVFIVPQLKSTVLPFVWLLMLSDLKDQARRLLMSCRNTLLRVKPASPTEMSVTYTTLSEN